MYKKLGLSVLVGFVAMSILGACTSHPSQNRQTASASRPGGDIGDRPERACSNVAITPECPINRCYPLYYEALAKYVSTLPCGDAIIAIDSCGDANTGTMPAVAAATKACDADKTMSSSIKQKAAALEKACLIENKSEGGSMGSYIRNSCKLSAYKELRH